MSFLCPFSHLFCRSRISCSSRPKRRDTLSWQFSFDSELRASGEERRHGERARGLKLSYVICVGTVTTCVSCCRMGAGACTVDLGEVGEQQQQERESTPFHRLAQ